MNSGHFTPPAETPGPAVLSLEIVGLEDKTPQLVPVRIRNLSTGGVTLTVTDPWNMPDWDRYRGENCVLRVEDPGGGEPVNMRAQIAWIRFGGTDQPPLSLGLQLNNPPGEGISRLSKLLPHTSQDIKGLWDRYDQVRKNPEHADWVHRSYIAGLGLLLGGLLLQVASSPGYRVCGWALWVLGSLGIAGKVIRPFWPKQPSSNRIGRSL